MLAYGITVLKSTISYLNLNSKQTRKVNKLQHLFLSQFLFFFRQCFLKQYNVDSTSLQASWLKIP